jgi:CRP-like cAMP-binding protein
LLAALGTSAPPALTNALQPVDLELGDVLYEIGQPIEHVLFPTLGVVSVISLVDDEIFESGTVGEEGFVGLPVVLDSGIPDDRATVQVRGHALRLPADQFRAFLAASPQLTRLLQAYSQVFLAQVARNGACSRAHPIRQRCARWLLLTSDRMRSDRFELKQEFLAQMLNVRRASVSEAAIALADLNCITYRRGVIQIVDREALEQASCSCYAVIRDRVDRLSGPAS